MFKILGKILAFLFSPKAQKAIDTADKVLGQVDKAVDAYKDAARKRSN